MLTLSIRQPWAWLILNAGKDIENREWSTRVRGTILIHTGKGMTREEYNIGEDALWAIDIPMVLPAYELLPRGGIVGQVDIIDCVDRSPSPWFNGPYGFVLHRPVELPFTPCLGKLGFFDALPPTT